MIIDKIVQKVLIKNLKGLKDIGVSFVMLHKEEMLELVKIEFKKYIEEHKEDIVNLLKDKATEIMKEFEL